jgi:hypothetical protein
MSSSLTKIILIALAMQLLKGCIADNAEDTNLPWASNKRWEGMAPISPTVMDRYD